MRKFAGIIAVCSLFGASLAISVPEARARDKPAADAEKTIPLPPALDKRFMDTTADPCVNFAKYACGNFSKLYPIPADKSGYGSFYIMYDHTQFALHALLEKVEANNASRTANEQKTGDFYATCMNKDAIGAAGLKPLQAEFDRIATLKSKSELTPLLAPDRLI